MKVVYKIAEIEELGEIPIYFHSWEFNSFQEALNHIIQHPELFEKEMNYTILPIITKNQ